MCPPAIPFIALGLSVLGTGAGIWGAVESAGAASAAGDEAQRQAEEAEEVARQNARDAQLAANDATQRGRLQAGEVRAEGSRIASEQQATYARSGIVASSGSAADMQAATKAAASMDAQTIGENARREAWGYKTQSARFQREADGTPGELERIRRETADRVAGNVLGGVAGAANGAVNAVSTYTSLRTGLRGT